MKVKRKVVTRIMIAGDLHISAKEPNGFQRLRDGVIIKNLDFLTSVIKKKRIDILVLNGDLYDEAYIAHRRRYVLMDFLYGVLQDTKAKIYIVPGNHDRMGREDPYGFMMLNSRVHVARRCEWVNSQLCLIPWGEKISTDGTKTLRKGLCSGKLFVTHLDCMNTIDGKLTKIGRQLRSFLGDKNLAVVGHIHTPKRKKINNLLFPGALVTNGFDEASHKGTYTIVELGKNEVLRSKVYNTPAHIHYASLDVSELGKKRKSILPMIVSLATTIVRRWKSSSLFSLETSLALRVIHRAEDAKEAKMAVRRMSAKINSLSAFAALRNRVYVTSKLDIESGTDNTFKEMAKIVRNKLDVIVRGGKETALRKYFKKNNVPDSVINLCLEILSDVSKK